MLLCSHFTKHLALTKEHHITYWQSHLETHLPANALHYCASLMVQYGIVLRIVRPRKGVLGNYNRQLKNGVLTQVVRINAGLSKELFLVVLLHEIAHWLVDEIGKKTIPHGLKWQAKFRELMLPILTNELFNEEQLQALQLEIQVGNTGACFTPALKRLLEPVVIADGHLEIKDLKAGAFFFHVSTPLYLLQKRRTRALCLDLEIGRNVLINMECLVRRPSLLEEQILKEQKSAYSMLATLELGTQFQFGDVTYVITAQANSQAVIVRKLRGKTTYKINGAVWVKRVKS